MERKGARRKDELEALEHEGGLADGVSEKISRETGALRFQARPHADGRVSVREREETACSTS